MIKIKNYFSEIYNEVTNSIAFYPSVISFAFFLLSWIAYELRNLGVTAWLIENAPYLVLSDADTGRTILSTLIGGLLSLVVFSFSMVMLLLSQASSDFSPRLLPGLISERKHQIVLGFYLGTIVYCIFTLISILPGGDKYQLPGFAILLGIVFGIVCMGMFVYFIHSISNAIQISNIMKKVYVQTKRRLRMQNDEKTRHERKIFSENDQNHVVKGKISGYFRGVNESSLLNLVMENDLTVKVSVIKGMYVPEGTAVLKVNAKTEKELQDKLLSCLLYDEEEIVDLNFVLGFKQITEIAVKAMSPGINDPGTAVSAVDYLTDLFALRMLLDDTEYLSDEEESLRVSFTVITFKDLLYNVLAPIRRYSGQDITVMQKLLLMTEYLLQAKAERESYKENLLDEVRAIMTDAEEKITNEYDLEVLQKIAGRIFRKHKTRMKAA